LHPLFSHSRDIIGHINVESNFVPLLIVQKEEKNSQILNLRLGVKIIKVPMALDMARTPNTLAPFQFMTFPPSPSILKSSSCLSGCTNKDNGISIPLMI